MSFPGSVLLSDKEAKLSSTTQRLPLGTRGYTLDGRAFRYVEVGGSDIVIGALVCSAAPDASLDADQELCTSTLYQTDSLTTASSQIYVKPAATEVVVADVYKEGYLWINDNTGEGQMLRIKDHLALDGTVSQVWAMNLMENSRLSATLDTTSEVGLLQNAYRDIIIRPDSARTSLVIGVTHVALTANYYGWIQTWGPCACDVVGSATVGDALYDDTGSGTGTAGTLHPQTTSTDGEHKVGELGGLRGYAIGPVASTEYALIDLRIAP